MGRQWNKFWIGLVLGIILPLMALLIFYFVRYANLPLSDFILYATRMKALPKILSLCAIPNLAVFYLFLNKEYWYATRGVIASTLLITLGMLAIKVFC